VEDLGQLVDKIKNLFKEKLVSCQQIDETCGTCYHIKPHRRLEMSWKYHCTDKHICKDRWVRCK
jgi:hypothetical protein